MSLLDDIERLQAAGEACEEVQVTVMWLLDDLYRLKPVQDGLEVLNPPGEAIGPFDLLDKEGEV